MIPRYYQRDAVDSVMKELREHQSTGLFLATGTGKSATASLIAKQWHARVLVLVDRTELVDQWVDTLKAITGEAVEVEQGRLQSKYARLVVGSVQSLNAQHRLDRIGRDAFSLVIVDEADVFITKKRLHVIGWFQHAKVLSLTATPDRHDGKGLKPIAETVAYEMDVTRAIDEGFLVPMVIGRVRINSIDISGVKKVTGDLQKAGLEKVMLKNVGAIVDKALELHPHRKAIFFFPGVESAKLACDRINAIDPGSCIFVDGKTPKEERKQLIEDFRAGKYTRMTNCEIGTRGFDVPDISLVVLARPTLSRAKHSQMIGRGTRTESGCIDGLTEAEQTDDRKAAIDWSDKHNTVVLDFCGNTGKHQLACVIDLVGKDYTEEERKVARKDLEAMGVDEVADPEELLKNARLKVEAAQRALRELEFRVSAQVDYVSATDTVGIDLDKIREQEMRLGVKEPSPAVKDQLERFGVEPKEVAKLTKLQAEKMMGKLYMRDKYGYCNYTQMKILKKWGIPARGVKRRQAAEAIAYLHKCGHGQRAPVDMAQLTALATGA